MSRFREITVDWVVKVIAALVVGSILTLCWIMSLMVRDPYKEAGDGQDK